MSAPAAGPPEVQALVRRYRVSTAALRRIRQPQRDYANAGLAAAARTRHRQALDARITELQDITEEIRAAGYDDLLAALEHEHRTHQTILAGGKAIGLTQQLRHTQQLIREAMQAAVVRAGQPPNDGGNT